MNYMKTSFDHSFMSALDRGRCELGRAGIFPVLLFAAALAGFAAPTPYKLADDGKGFAEQALETNRFRVSFTANSRTPRETVENYLLYWAAEITLENGKDYFVVVERDTERLLRCRPSLWETPYGRAHHRRDYRHYSFPRFHDSLFTGYPVGRPITSFHAMATILIYDGEKPEDAVDAYTARDVAEHLGPTIVRPEETMTN